MKIGKIYKVKPSKYFYYEKEYGSQQQKFDLSLSPKDLFILLEIIFIKSQHKISFKILIDGKIIYINGIFLGTEKIFDLLNKDFDAIID